MILFMLAQMKIGYQKGLAEQKNETRLSVPQIHWDLKSISANKSFWNPSLKNNSFLFVILNFNYSNKDKVKLFWTQPVII